MTRMTSITSRAIQCALATLVLLFAPAAPVRATESSRPDLPADLAAAMRALSAATEPGGEGSSAYAQRLARDFSRWTLGAQAANDRQAWVRGVADWFDAGWRVSERRSQLIDVDLEGEFAFVRRIVDETYRGPANEVSASRAALAETWVRQDGSWKLLRVDALPLEAQPAAAD